MQLAKYVKFREEKFGGVLFETRSEKVFTLNPTATAVVREIQSGATDENAIVHRLKDRFDDGTGSIERDVAALLADLRQRGLIEG
jgi:PqqD family protein of HPr-rel-A system